VWSVIFCVVLFVAFHAINAQKIIEAQNVIADNGVVTVPSGASITTMDGLDRHVRKQATTFVFLGFLALWGVAALINAVAGAKGKLS